MERHFGLDWLRIGAFGLLILYHTGMVFVPWGFHIKTAQPLPWVEVPMLLTSPWRLTLLFVVSGYASRALLAKSSGFGNFIGNRTTRLMIPFIFGMIVIIPPQTWVEVVGQHGYSGSYLHFWLSDYFRFGTMFGIVMPTWNHLWFVLYLWFYTLLLAGLAAVMPPQAQTIFDRVFDNGRALWLPVIWLLLTQSILFTRMEDTHDLIHDVIAHLRYIPAFLFGFGLARSPTVMNSLVRRWKISAGFAVAAYLVIAGSLIAYPDFDFPTTLSYRTYQVARDVSTWIAIVALIGIAGRFWNHDHQWRPILTEAVFPFYIIHQTIIIVTMFWVKPLALGPAAEFMILILSTVAGCWVFYLVGREFGVLRTLIGLRGRKVAAVPGANPMYEHCTQR